MLNCSMTSSAPVPMRRRSSEFPMRRSIVRPRHRGRSKRQPCLSRTFEHGGAAQHHKMAGPCPTQMNLIQESRRAKREAAARKKSRLSSGSSRWTKPLSQSSVFPSTPLAPELKPLDRSKTSRYQRLWEYGPSSWGDTRWPRRATQFSRLRYPLFLKRYSLHP